MRGAGEELNFPFAIFRRSLDPAHSLRFLSSCVLFPMIVLFDTGDEKLLILMGRQNFRISSKVLVNQVSWACAKQGGSLYMACAKYFLCYCSWGNPSSAFFRRGEPAFEMPGRPNSRGRLSLKAKPDPQRSSNDSEVEPQFHLAFTPVIKFWLKWDDSKVEPQSAWFWHRR